MDGYKPGKTVGKMVKIGALVGGANVAASALPVESDDLVSWLIVTLVTGLFNWFKNRGKR